MNSLLTVFDNFFSGYKIEALDILSITASVFGIAVIINKNPIGSLLWLIGLFGLISIYLIISGLTFIGFSYLIVYIGAVSILFLFILMLIDIRTSELQSNNSNSIPLALLISIFWNYALFNVLPYYLSILNTSLTKLSLLIYGGSIANYSDVSTLLGKLFSNVNVMYITSNNWDGNITETSHISAIGNILYTTYNMWLFLASFILLLAMVGAIVITIKQDK
jgi:NADH-ubiquinone oxidoreductase chain 6